MEKENTIEIYVTLLEEGTPTIRPTQAIDLGNETYKLLATHNYDPVDEIWEFVPGSIVKVVPIKANNKEDALLAVKLAS